MNWSNLFGRVRAVQLGRPSVEIPNIDLQRSEVCSLVFWRFEQVIDEMPQQYLFY